MILFSHIFDKQHKLSDALRNAWIRFKANNFPKRVPTPSMDHLVFNSEFIAPVGETTEEPWKQDWRVGQPWGRIHVSDYPTIYYDNAAVIQHPGKGLILDTFAKEIVHSKESFPEHQHNVLGDRQSLTTYVSSGVVSSKRAFKYGVFEFEFVLPKGPRLWPAIWLHGKETWPPEIDLFEGYSNWVSSYHFDNTQNARKQISLSEFKPNLWYFKHGRIENYGPYSVKFQGKLTDIHKATLVWEEHLIEMYYDNVLIFRCTDDRVLSLFDEHMYIVAGVGPRNNCSDSNQAKYLWPRYNRVETMGSDNDVKTSPMVLLSANVYQEIPNFKNM